MHPVRKSILLFALLLLTGPALYAQQTLLDSLQQKVQTAPDDSLRIKWMIEVLNIYNYELSPEAVPYARRIVQVAETSGNPRLKANALMCVGAAYFFRDSAQAALIWFDRARPLVIKYGTPKLQYNYYNLTGLCYTYLHRLPEAIQAYLHCEGVLRQIDDDDLAAAVYINLSNIYTETKDTLKAFDNAAKALDVTEKGLAKLQQGGAKGGDQTMQAVQRDALMQSQAIALISMAQIRNMQQDYPAAITYVNRAMAVGKVLNDPHIDAQTLQVLAGSYDHPRGDYQRALGYYRQSLEIARGSEYKEDVIFALMAIGKVEALLGHYREAADYHTQALAISRQHAHIRSELEILEQLSGYHRKLGNFQMADSFFRNFVTLRDSVNSVEQQKDFVRNEERYAYQQRHFADSLKQANERRELAFRMQRQRSVLYGVIGGLIALGLIIYLFFRTRRVRREMGMKAAFSKKVAEVEMQALRAQMNPHFIFNCLNSINRYILKSDAITASNYLTKFAKLMRLILDSSAEDSNTLENERQLLSLYAEMEALRFNKRFDYSVTVAETLPADEIRIPSMIIQPYVENAIWHGLMHKESEGHLRIHFSPAGDHMLKVTIEDDGIGRKKAGELKSRSSLKHKSYGMQITGDRLQIVKELYHAEASVAIEDLQDEQLAAAGTRVVLHLPYKTAPAGAGLN